MAAALLRKSIIMFTLNCNGYGQVCALVARMLLLGFERTSEDSRPLETARTARECQEATIHVEE